MERLIDYIAVKFLRLISTVLTILLDESNGNGIFAVKASSPPSHAVLATSVSNEDLSLSEYTDAEESMSAPTEFLAEFLSAVMLKDYKTALKYCKLILHYEPNNATAKEFHPLILEKLKFDSSSESDENYNKSSSPEDYIDHVTGGEEEPEGAAESDNSSSIGGSEILSSSGSGPDAEISGSNGPSDSEDADGSTSDSDENNLEASNSNTSTSRSDNTTHSYSSLLLEEDDEAPPLVHNKDICTPNLDLSNGNLKSTSCSDSESPTEPLTQRLVAMLRSKCVPGKATST